MQITFEQFERHLKDVMLTMEMTNELYDLTEKYSRLRRGDFDISFPSLIDNMIGLLATLTNDPDEWIEYWVYTLECGKRAEEYNITDENNNPIPLSSIEDLWNLLVSQENNSEEK